MKNIGSYQNKKILLISLFLVVIILVFLYGNYRKNMNSVIPNNKSLYVRFEASDIVGIQNKLPVSDTLGKKFNGEGTEDGVQGYLEFSITNNENNKVKYEIIATKQKVDGKEINNHYVKMYLTNIENEPLPGFDLNSVPVYYYFPKANDRSSGKVLYTGVLQKNSSETFKLHMWLADNYGITTIPESFKVDIDVQVK